MIAPRTAIPGLALSIAPDALRELVAIIVREVIEQFANVESQLPANRLAFTREELAKATGLKTWIIRDCERRGELAGRRCGKKTIYTREAVAAWLQAKG